MKRIWTALLAITLTLGQAPAWVLVCSQRCMPQGSLACLRACAKSQALLTQHGSIPSVGQKCAQVEAHFADATLAAVSAPSPVLPALNYVVPVTGGEPQIALLTVRAQANAPPCAAPAQVLLSVPVAQAPPVALFV